MRKEHGYILRYYLPMKPHFDENYTKKRFDELLDFVSYTKTKAVMFYVALDPNWYYMPATSEYEESVAKEMLPYIKILKERGISYQLNFQNILGSVHGGGDFTDKMGWENIADQFGNTMRGVACPIGKVFREKTAKRLKTWANTHPDIIWIDDDFRLHNHGAPTLMQIEGKPTYTEYYCFCDNHINLFNEKYCTSFDRETLVKEMLKSGDVSDVRIKYLDFLRDTMTESAKWVSDTVHGVDKNIKIAQMTSSMEAHATENRDWKDFLTALSGEHNPVTRPHFGPYRETDPKDFASCFITLAKSMTALSSSYGDEVEYCPEIENTRFTTWTKSASATAYQLGLSAFMGAKDTTLSIYDLDGGAFFDEPLYKKMLKTKKPVFDKITSIGLDKVKPVGVICPLILDAGKRFKLSDGDNYASLGWKNKNIDGFLVRMGIATRYSSDILNETGTFAIDGYSANVLTDEELNHILGQKVLIDGKGAEILINRGFGDKIGVSDFTLKTVTISAEIINKFTRTDGTYIRIPSRIPPLRWNKFTYDDETEILSQFLTCEGETTSALTRFTNKIGGNVVIYPAFNDWGDGLYNGYRLRLFKEVLKENDTRLKMVETQRHALVVTKNLGDDTYYFIANLSTDPLTEITIENKKIKTNLSTYGFVVVKSNGKKYKVIAEIK